jgi:ABC-type multidrug transport system fused ATPase/permease subunit
MTRKKAAAIELKQTSLKLLRFVGYVLLTSSFVNYLAILLPPQLTNPNWEFQVMGQMVDNVWSILLGLTFIFLFQSNTIISARQVTVLKLLSWISLLIGIIFFLMLPLGINNSLTIYRNINSQFNTQQAEQRKQIEVINQRLQEVTSPQQITGIANSLNIPIQPNSSESVPDLKQRISQQIKTSARNAQNNANAARREQIKNLIKTAIRVNLGVIISGVCLIGIWRLTQWVRIIHLG